MPLENLSPDLAIEQQLLQQKEQLAHILAQRGMQGVQSTNPMSPVNPMQGAAQMLYAYKGGRARDEAATGQRNLGEKYNQLLASGVQDYARQRSGSPEISQPASDLGGGPGRPAVAADPQGAMVSALMSRNPLLRQLGGMDYQHELKKSDPYTLGPDAKRVIPGANGSPATEVTNPKGPEHAIPSNWLSMLPAGATREANDPTGVFRLPGTDGQKDVYYMEFERGALKGYKKMDSSQRTNVTNHNPAAVTTTQVIDPTNDRQMLTVDARVYKGGGLGSAGVIGVSGKLGDREKLNAKREFNMQGLGKTLQEAEDLLTGKATGPDGKPLNKPTGSGVGSVVDMAAGLVGKSPSGAVEAQRMKAIGGALTSKMPRMEGPQSDKDVALYKEMAAQIGDSSVPRDRRLGALHTVRELWQKYEHLPENAHAFADRRALGNVVDFNSLPK